MRITECRKEDLDLLDERLPFRGVVSPHRDRFARQAEGLTTFLLAWDGALPVGSCEIRWEGCAAPEVQARHPGCPEVYGLGWPGALPSRPVGTGLLREAERRAVVRDRASLGLGVEKNNPRAAALYRRLGFRGELPYLDCWSYEDGAGVLHRVADACVFMTKPLPPAHT